MKRLILPALLFLASSGPSTDAYAKTTLYDWTGVVTNPDWKVSSGDLIRGTLQIADSNPLSVDTGSSRLYSSPAILTFQAGGETFTRESGCDWWVSNTGQGIGSAPMRSDTTVGDVDWVVFAPNQDLSLAQADSLEGKTGSWGADVWDNITQKERNFWGNILTIRKDQPLVAGPLTDAAPTPEPSSLVLMGTALLGFGFYRRRSILRLFR